MIHLCLCSPSLISTSLEESLVSCPICEQRMKQAVINAHLDRCMRGDSSFIPSVSSSSSRVSIAHLWVNEYILMHIFRLHLLLDSQVFIIVKHSGSKYNEDGTLVTARNIDNERVHPELNHMGKSLSNSYTTCLRKKTYDGY